MEDHRLAKIRNYKGSVKDFIDYWKSKGVPESPYGEKLKESKIPTFKKFSEFVKGHN